MFSKPSSKVFRFQPVPQSPLSRPSTPSSVTVVRSALAHHEDRAQTPWFLVVLASFCIIVIALISFYIGRNWEAMMGNKVVSVLGITQYSPILEDISLTYTLTPFNGSLLKPNIYRGDASAEVDAAWEALGVNYRSIAIPPSLAQISGLAPSHVHLNEKYGGGYPANVEGLHQLHCLNLLRQSLFYNYNYYKGLGNGAFKNDMHILKLHISHCLDTIRQQLMCQVDIGFMGQIWIHPKEPEPFVDFNTMHKCRDFEAIRE
ncbi:hypothetical protein B0O99DRAFT_652245 [Bisporella sp. PMI_857]|nr:hypothetical protein B0O99DRAFT_652245 [Bisporella sp. PMI_857]